MLVSLTVGKVDAGVAVLLTEDKRLIEFPSILLPPDISSGSIVDIHVARNLASETIAQQQFNQLQDSIVHTFGINSPSAPILRLRNATQTSVVLEWDPIQLATADLRSLSLYRNGSKAGSIPRDKLSTKISGLAVDTEYTFHLVLRTSAGTYTSEKLVVRTHKMTDLSGITVTPGIMPSQLRDSLADAVQRIGAKLIDTVRIDTTHFVCTEGRGQAWEKAVEMNVPVVVPDWVIGCEREGRLVGVRGYYLNADPKTRQVGSMGPQAQAVLQAQQQHMADRSRESPRIEHTPPTPERSTREQPEANGMQEDPISPEPPTPPPKLTPELGKHSLDSTRGSQESEGAPHEASPAATDTIRDGKDSDESERTEKEIVPPTVNSLAAVGIPHEPLPGAADAQKPGGEDEGEFDDVKL
ncbi:hypothetical protein LTR50_002088 [Elasticomyces elasticus]|nr:hypothetical protein LTR50_002088 [Elasticomyces elasticus]